MNHATYCPPCDASVVAMPTEDPRVHVLMEYERDGFTPSPDRHICWPREERIGRLIMQRRRRLAPVIDTALPIPAFRVGDPDDPDRLDDVDELADEEWDSSGGCPCGTYHGQRNGAMVHCGWQGHR